jgi:hypothetical protein
VSPGELLQYMNLPMHLRTGNKRLDKLIAEQHGDKLAKLTPLEILNGESEIPDEPENKYGVVPKEERTYKDGTVFASKAEMERYEYLLNLQRAREIKDLRIQITYPVFDAFVSVQYGDIEAIIYVADFDYINISYRKECAGKLVVEDSKTGVKTAAYKYKRKLFLYRYPEILFFEV